MESYLFTVFNKKIEDDNLLLVSLLLTFNFFLHSTLYLFIGLDLIIGLGMFCPLSKYDT